MSSQFQRRLARRCGAGALAFALSAALAHANPVGFAGSWMTMGDVGREFQQLDTMYSPTARYSWAGTATRMRDPDRDTRVDLLVAHYNRLLYRHSTAGGQFNVYAAAGVGMAWSNAAFQADREQGVVSLAGQVDYETRRIYLAAKTHVWRAERFTVANNTVQAGFSFYATEWDETQPWLIGEVGRMPGMTDDWQSAIYLRLVNKGFFVEAGIDQDRRPKLNFRYTF